MWSPSSLIFLVLLGVWAAYFLQYWIRRRDHLATARSVEQFSEAMRVLERRDTTPRTDLSEPAPRSWDVRPGVASTRPQVLVKRAVPAEPARPVLSERVRHEPGRRRPASTPPSRSGAAATHPHAPASTSAAGPPPAAGRGPAAGSPVEAPQPRRVRPSRRVRAVLMLLSLAGLLAVSTLVVVGRLPYWAVAPAAVGFVAAFAYVRSGVRAEQALRAARRRRHAQRRRSTAEARAERPSGHGGASERAAGASTGAQSARAGAPDDTTAPTGVTDQGGSQTPAEDLPGPAEAGAAAHEATVSTAEPSPAVAAPAEAADDEPGPVEEVEFVHLVDEDDIPLTWEPVPVPRPTYTMKARAERPEVTPAEVTPDAGQVALASDEDSLEERRVAGA